MLGIGVTGHSRPDVLQNSIDMIKKHTGKHELFVYEDKEGRGVAYSKNECLKKLRDHDHIILFDDDCHPIANGWDEQVVKAQEESQSHHFLFMVQGYDMFPVEQYDTENFTFYGFNKCGGAFVYLTKEAISKVGGYNKDYGRYGFEHAGYSERIYKAGLSLFKYPTIKWMDRAIQCLDYTGEHHNPSIPLKDIPGCLAKNQPIYLKDIQTIYQEL